MTELYKCDWKCSEQCIGTSDDRSNFMSVTIGNDQQTKTHCCYNCLPDWIPTPSHAENVGD